MKFANTPSGPVTVSNLAGGQAYLLPLRMKLLTFISTSFVEDQFYRSAKEGLRDLDATVRELINGGDAFFVAKAALWARHRLHMRSVTHVLGAMVGRYVTGVPWKRKFFRALVARPDDITETLGYFMSTWGKRKIPSAMSRGFGDMLSVMSEYALAKYKGGSHKLKMVDAVNLFHPKATPALNKLMRGELSPAGTWEVLVSQAGSDPEKKRQAWDSLVMEDKLGYMALLRNLRNIHQHASSTSFVRALERISDYDEVRNSKQLPFRFWSAMKVVESDKLPPAAMVALDKALSYSLENIPELGGHTLVAADFSGSMNVPLSNKGSTTLREIATLLAVALAQKCGADFCFFGNDCMGATIHPHDSIMGQVNKTAGYNYTSHIVGHGTSIPSVLRYAEKQSCHYDRIVILTDVQSWCHNDIKNISSFKDTTIYTVDLTGYGSSFIHPGQKRHHISGFSDNIFRQMSLLEKEPDALYQEIENWSL